MPFLSGTQIEIVTPEFRRGDFRACVFDFDGTLSLVRRNWPAVMIPMMVDLLAALGADETRAALSAHVEEYVMGLNGRPTIYQMIRLAEEIRLRGGTPLDPEAYKNQYHELLFRQVKGRIESLQAGRIEADDLTVPDARRMLQQLTARGLALYLASGTELIYVREEITILKLASFFDPHIYGALEDDRAFSKGLVIEQILRELSLSGPQLIAFGDGVVEIQEIKKVGGLAVGVASEEETRAGVNPWKRQRLIEAGADLIIGDYREQDRLLELLEI